MNKEKAGILNKLIFEEALLLHQGSSDWTIEEAVGQVAGGLLFVFSEGIYGAPEYEEKQRDFILGANSSIRQWPHLDYPKGTKGVWDDWTKP